MSKKLIIQPKGEIDPKDYDIGVIIARFQVHKLHEGHTSLIDEVFSNHKKVIIFLGVSVTPNTPRNPLDFATRKAMLQELYPEVIILPLKDQRSNKIWSKKLDEKIDEPFGSKKALLYGGRESFIPYYSGKHQTMELVSNEYFSGTEIRKKVAREILKTSDFRAGVIHSCAAQRPIAYPCVDVAPIKEEDGVLKILLAKKSHEENWRFIGGHVDPTDMSLEHAARREFSEETNMCEINNLEYVTSILVKDWRYSNEKSDIITTLFKGTFTFGSPRPMDDIEALKWFELNEKVMDDMVEEHLPLMDKLLTTI